MVLDASVLVAVLLREAGYEFLLARIETAITVCICAPTLLEANMVLSGRMRRDATSGLRLFLNRFRIEVVPFSEAHYEVASTAFQRFGKGRHPAALNFGDCIAYSTSVLTGLPLLYCGNDFSRTDIEAAT